MKIDKRKVGPSDVEGKRVLVRADFNVPLKEDLTIADDTRIKAALPTIKLILENHGSVVLLSHLGRPKGIVNLQMSLGPVAKHLSGLLGQEVLFSKDCIGDEAQNKKKNLKPGQVLLLENLRFHSEEERGDPQFARALAENCDIYIDDAFSCAHRAHASITEVTRSFPGRTYRGLNLAQEVETLSKYLLEPQKPFAAIIGGAKISSKIGVLKKLIEKADSLFIGGAMANTFLKAEGLEMGQSLVEPEYETEAKNILSTCQSEGVALYLPLDLVGAPSPEMAEEAKVYPIDAFPKDQMALDLGPKTLESFQNALASSKTVFWNGPLGRTEFPEFSKGTEQIAQVLGKLSAVKIVGGGDSIAALNKLGLAAHFTYLCTGGGASLEFIENGTLPGLEVL